MRITSPQNPRVKEAMQLRDRKGREQQQRLIIDGRRELACALAAGFVLSEVFIHPATSGDAEGVRLREELERLNVRIWDVSAEPFRKLSFGNRDEGFVAIARTRHRELAQFTPAPRAGIIVLDGVEKPGNVGAILRTADATGVSAVILTNPGTDIYNPNTIRASLGAVFTIPVFVAAVPLLRNWLREHVVNAFTARVDGGTPYDQHDFRAATAFVLGSEAVGLNSQWVGNDLKSVYLPMLGRVDSLNVSNTAAVLLYEMLRQRRVICRGEPNEPLAGGD